MGHSQMTINYVITRQNNGLLLFGEKTTQELVPQNCIRCGRCINSCPVGLSPVDILNAYEKYDSQMLDRLMADLCIGCGTCGYVCPAKRPLTQTVGLAKGYLRRSDKRGEKS